MLRDFSRDVTTGLPRAARQFYQAVSAATHGFDIEQLLAVRWSDIRLLGLSHFADVRGIRGPVKILPECATDLERWSRVALDPLGRLVPVERPPRAYVFGLPGTEEPMPRWLLNWLLHEVRFPGVIDHRRILSALSATFMWHPTVTSAGLQYEAFVGAYGGTTPVPPAFEEYLREMPFLAPKDRIRVYRIRSWAREFGPVALPPTDPIVYSWSFGRSHQESQVIALREIWTGWRAYMQRRYSIAIPALPGWPANLIEAYRTLGQPDKWTEKLLFDPSPAAETLRGWASADGRVTLRMGMTTLPRYAGCASRAVNFRERMVLLEHPWDCQEPSRLSEGPNGWLALRELPHYPREALESRRGPLRMSAEEPPLPVMEDIETEPALAPDEFEALLEKHWNQNRPPTPKHLPPSGLAEQPAETEHVEIRVPQVIGKEVLAYARACLSAYGTRYYPPPFEAPPGSIPANSKAPLIPPDPPKVDRVAPDPFHGIRAKQPQEDVAQPYPWSDQPPATRKPKKGKQSPSARPPNNQATKPTEPIKLKQPPGKPSIELDTIEPEPAPAPEPAPEPPPEPETTPETTPDPEAKSGVSHLLPEVFDSEEREDVRGVAIDPVADPDNYKSTEWPEAPKVSARDAVRDRWVRESWLWAFGRKPGVPNPYDLEAEEWPETYPRFRNGFRVPPDWLGRLSLRWRQFGLFTEEDEEIPGLREYAMLIDPWRKEAVEEWDRESDR